VRKNRSLDGLPTGTVVSTFLTPSASPKFCVRRNDEKGDEPTVVVGAREVRFDMMIPKIHPTEIAGIDENRTVRTFGLKFMRTSWNPH
jgi:hypothetical protein